MKFHFNHTQQRARTIFCIDLKSFFASVSSIMRGLDPLTVKLAVVGNTEQRGSVVLAATPKLKKLGIKTGSRLYEIQPSKDIIIVNPSMAEYVRISNDITEIFLKYVAPYDLHTLSIDESFLDVSDFKYQRLHKMTSWELAKVIQKDILETTGITATVGMGPNLFLAKMALYSAKKVKDGIDEWTMQDVPRKLWPLPLTEMYGVNVRTERRLNRMGIFSVQQLAKHPVALLKKELGVLGLELRQHANGMDESQIDEPYTPVSTSIGKSQILMRDYVDIQELKVLILEQLEEVCFRMRCMKKLCRTIHLSVGYSRTTGGGGFSHSYTLFEPTNITMELYKVCLHLFEMYYNQSPVRQIGMSLTNFVAAEERQLSIFEDVDKRGKEEKLALVMDEIRRKYGKNALLRAVSYTSGSTAKHRNTLIGGHKSE